MRRSLWAVALLVSAATLVSGCGSSGDGRDRYGAHDASSRHAPMPGGRLTNHLAGFADVMFVTMAVPVERRLITLTASSRSTGTFLPPSFLTDVRKTARDRLWVEAAQL